jgi:UDP-N-acetylglucosamine acyltransferase
MGSLIHETAIIDPTADIASDVKIGPYTTIGPDVKIGSGTEVGSHNVIKGPCTIGENNRIFQFNSIGESSPDLKYKGERTTLVIGDNNTIRECVTIHRGTVQDRSETTIGNHNLLMAYTHVGHDSVISNHCIMANSAQLAGHCFLGDWAIVSGMSGVHQYASVGKHGFVGGFTFIDKDVPAFVMAQGVPAKPRAVNVEGLRRRNFEEPDIKALQTAFKTLYKRKLGLADAVNQLEKQAKDNRLVADLLESVIESRRGIVR